MKTKTGERLLWRSLKSMYSN